MNRSNLVAGVRWVLVLPAAIAAIFAVIVLLTLLIMFTFGGLGHDPLIHINDKSVLEGIQRFMQSILCPAAFVVAGSMTAPRRHRETSVALASILVVFVLALAAYMHRIDRAIPFDVVWAIGVLTGATGGVYVVRRKTS